MGNVITTKTVQNAVILVFLLLVWSRHKVSFSSLGHKTNFPGKNFQVGLGEEWERTTTSKTLRIISKFPF